MKITAHGILSKASFSTIVYILALHHNFVQSAKAHQCESPEFTLFDPSQSAISIQMKRVTLTNYLSDISEVSAHREATQDSKRS